MSRLKTRKIKVLLSMFAIFFVVGSWTDDSFAKRPLCYHDENQFNCVEYVDNYDGDTISVNIPGVHQFFAERVPVRVYGVDAPERRTRDKCEKVMAERAREFTQEFMLKGRFIELKNIQRDKYFRILADVFVDGRSLGEELLRRRLAVEYFGTTRPDVNWCQYR